MGSKASVSVVVNEPSTEVFQTEQSQETLEQDEDFIPTLEPEITGAPSLEGYEKYNEIVPIINKVAKEMNFDPLILASIILTESLGDANAKRHEENRYNQIKSAFEANPKYKEHYNILKQKGLVQNEEEYFQIMSSYDRGLTQIAPATAVAYTSWRGHPDKLYNPETNLRVIIEFLRNRGFNDESDVGLRGAIVANTIVNTNSRTGTPVEGHTERATGYWADLTNKAKIECHSPCKITFNNPIVMYREEFQNAVLIKSKNAKISKDFSIIENFEGAAEEFRTIYIGFYTQLFVGKRIDSFRFFNALTNLGITSDEAKRIVIEQTINLYLRDFNVNEDVKTIVQSISKFGHSLSNYQQNFEIFLENQDLFFKLADIEIEKMREINEFKTLSINMQAIIKELKKLVKERDDILGEIKAGKLDKDTLKLFQEELFKLNKKIKENLEILSDLILTRNQQIKKGLFYGSVILFNQKDLSVKNINDEIKRFFYDLDVWSNLQTNSEQVLSKRGGDYFVYKSAYFVSYGQNDYDSDIVEHFIRRHIFGDVRMNEPPTDIFRGYEHIGKWTIWEKNKISDNEKRIIIYDILHRIFSGVSVAVEKKGYLVGDANRQDIRFIVDDNGKIVNVVPQ